MDYSTFLMITTFILRRLRPPVLYCCVVLLHALLRVGVLSRAVLSVAGAELGPCCDPPAGVMVLLVCLHTSTAAAAVVGLCWAYVLLFSAFTAPVLRSCAPVLLCICTAGLQRAAALLKREPLFGDI